MQSFNPKYTKENVHIAFGWNGCSRSGFQLKCCPDNYMLENPSHNFRILFKQLNYLRIFIILPDFCLKFKYIVLYTYIYLELNLFLFSCFYFLYLGLAPTIKKWGR